ncbi:hypothetical protein CDD80_4034 [Ophiocordyceps camponoti-rufipedis]|uniref:tRNA 4-demethylwyosine synthase (AdoMet-dependent) n=1 Tax=Ophiocordyceps camponoti-rufipedis TaxID=2004952 RepID=A0A2C5Z193_9HYPO|nr:hypothetical protein CDD80_4034 [Ophiocordyceps camponoti-rufipedis]
MPPSRTRKRPAPLAVDPAQDETARTKRPALAAVSDDPTVLAGSGTQEPDPIDLTQEPDEPATELYGHLGAYDRNAIRVDNVLHQQIGHLPRTVVEKIAPFMVRAIHEFDSGDIKLEAELTGEKGMFDCPVRLSFFGPSDPAERARIEQGLKASRLLKATQLKQTKQQAQALRAASGLKSGSTSYGIGSDVGGITQAELSLEELIKKSDATEFRRGGDAIKTLAIDEAYLAAMPMAEQPPQLASTLLPYQLQARSHIYIILRTFADHTAGPVQLWVKSSKGMFWNLASGFVSPNAPKLCSGGILADDMGLGKTLQVISLILTGGSGPTLIVAPVSVMSNWKQQIARHVKPEQAPSVLVYHGNKKMTAQELTKYDVVITSYGRLAKERDQTQRTLLDKSVQWRRVVLDEGHTIRNARTKAALAACELQAESRWVLTGTPIVNSVKDLHSLVQFLHLTGGIEQVEIFNNSITRKLTAGERGGEAILQALVQDICLRRKKDMEFVDLKLPEKKEFLHRIPFQPAEKVKYNALLSEARGALEEYQARSASGQKGRFQNVLERLLRLRQTCNHWTLCRERIDDLMKLLEEENVVVLNDKNRALLQEALRLYVESQDDCAICYEAPSPPVITNCKHVFCRPCITKAIQIQHKCPMCRNALTEECLLEPAPEGTFDDNFDTDTQSSKTDALLQIVQATVQKPGSKVIVFSQWTSFLNIVQNQLVKAGLKFSRIDGSMNAEKRDRAIEALDHDADTRVMLASLAVCSVGLNLVAADTVILSDSWWAPAIEDQAIDRVHRLGQTRETTIWRLVMENSVEERVLTIQAEKRELVGKAFCEKSKKENGSSFLHIVGREDIFSSMIEDVNTLRAAEAVLKSRAAATLVEDGTRDGNATATPAISLRTAATRFGVSKSAVARAIEQIEGRRPRVKAGKPTLLTEKEDETLVGFIHWLETTGSPATRPQIMGACHALMKRRNAEAKSPSDSWYGRWMATHGDLRLRIVKVYDKARRREGSGGKEVESDILSFLDECERSGRGPGEFAAGEVAGEHSSESSAADTPEEMELGVEPGSSCRPAVMEVPVWLPLSGTIDGARLALADVIDLWHAYRTSLILCAVAILFALRLFLRSHQEETLVALPSIYRDRQDAPIEKTNSGPRRIKGGAVKKVKRPVDDAASTMPPVKLVVFYSSVTDTTAKLAGIYHESLVSAVERLARETGRPFLKPELHHLAEMDLDDFFVAPPTAPTEAGLFYLFLFPSYNIDSINDTVLQHLRETHHDFRIDTAPLASLLGYSVFGYGDREGWPDEERGFCFQAIELDKCMSKLTGRKRAYPVGMGDVKGDHRERFSEWAAGVEDVVASVARTGHLGLGVRGSGDAVESDDEEVDGGGEEAAGQQGERPLDDVEDLGKMLRTSGSKSGANSGAKPPLAVDFTTYSQQQTPAVVKEMVPRDSPTYAALTKQGYTIVGSHSGVKICRWTKSALRGRGSCYKYSLYGINSHQCMETTPSLSCSNKCVFCWRHGTNPVGTTWRWVVDAPDVIFRGVKEGHYSKIRMMRGVPGVRAERYAEALRIRHCALSLVGEPIFYPYINEFLALLHAEGISSFLVCNAQHPDQLAALKAVTQLYVSIDASNRESLRKIDRPLHRDFWERFLRCLDILREKRFRHRTVFRLTLVKGFNVADEVEGYARLVERGLPCFIEVKGVTYCGTSTSANAGISMSNVPFYWEVCDFVRALDARLADMGLAYGIAAEHAHSCCVLLASERFRVDGLWRTHIDYRQFFQLLQERGADGDWSPEDYMGDPTPEWALWGNGGFDPRDTRVDRKGRSMDVTVVRHRPPELEHVS